MHTADSTVLRIQRIRQPSRRHYQQSMLHYHLKLFLVECFTNVFYYKKTLENKKNVKNVKNVTRIKNVKNVFTSMSSTTFTQSVPKATEFVEITLPLGLLRRSRSAKVTEFGTNRKRICNFLLVINTNLAPILHRFRDTAVSYTHLTLPTILRV